MLAAVVSAIVSKRTEEDQSKELRAERRQDLWLTLREEGSGRLRTFNRTASHPGNLPISVAAADEFWDTQLSPLKEGDKVLAYISNPEQETAQAYHLRPVR